MKPPKKLRWTGEELKTEGRQGANQQIHGNCVRFIEKRGDQWDLHCLSHLFIRVLGVERVRFPSPALLVLPAANDLLHPCKPTPIPYKIAKPILAKNGLYT